jgi:fumarylacetoacetase
LNQFAALGRSVQRNVRIRIQELFSAEQLGSFSEGSLQDAAEVEMHLPVSIGDFTDFSASKDHCLNASEAIFGQRSLPPAFLNFPIAYAGRASSIVISGTPIERPQGQFRGPDGVIFGPSRAMDYELEFGAVIGKPLPRNQHLDISDAEEHIFGYVIVNDWSGSSSVSPPRLLITNSQLARDIQGLEMNPLGPFNGKNFGTSISPWVVVPDALKPFGVPAPARDQKVAAYLDDPDATIYNIELQAEILAGGSSTVVCRTNLKLMYWNFRHMIAHHVIGGCDLKTGDLIASGTVSGPGDLEHGCLLESSLGGKRALKMEDGSTRTYLEDGDVVRFTGKAGVVGISGVGFGQCVGEVRGSKIRD